jgi:hypothetical protein
LALTHFLSPSQPSFHVSVEGLFWDDWCTHIATCSPVLQRPVPGWNFLLKMCLSESTDLTVRLFKSVFFSNVKLALLYMCRTNFQTLLCIMSAYYFKFNWSEFLFCSFCISDQSSNLVLNCY